jgi:predicted dehydrogenase
MALLLYDQIKEGPQSEVKTFDVAVVGCGNVAEMHFQAYAAHPERVRIVAACDPVLHRAEELGRRYGVERVFSSLDELIMQAEWEVAVVCTPTHVRTEIVGALASAAKHVFVEKPLTDHFGAAKDMVEACDEAGVTLAVNQNFRYHYPFNYARDSIDSGDVGSVVSVLHDDLTFRQDTGWRTKSQRHALSVMGVHWLDGFRWSLNQDAEAILSQTRSSPAIDCVGETDACVQLTFQSGIIVSFRQSFSSPVRREGTIILGDERALVLSYESARLFSPGNEEPKQAWTNPYRGSNKPEATFKGLESLLTAIEQGGEPGNSGRDNLKTIALLDGAYQSAEEGRPILLQGGIAA